jgi:hypothetical protein
VVVKIQKVDYETNRIIGEGIRQGMELFSGSCNDLLGCGYTVLRLNGIYARQRITGNRDYSKPYILKRRYPMM